MSDSKRLMGGMLIMASCIVFVLAMVILQQKVSVEDAQLIGSIFWLAYLLVIIGEIIKSSE
ncbi:MAG: hypothetical protein Q6363_008195 [Candidatus Njordarchaeota archaeon]